MKSWEENNKTSSNEKNRYAIDDAVVIDLSKLLSIQPQETIKLIFETILVVTLFTGMHVATVRDPSLFDATKAKIKVVDSFNHVGRDFAKKYGFFNYKLTKKDYVLANEILVKASKYRKNTADFTKLYRGLNSVSFNTLNSWVRTDSEFEIGDIVSSTTDIFQAWTFYRSYGPYHVLYDINNPSNRGMNVGSLSSFGGEKEVIISGKVRVTGCEGPHITQITPDIKFVTSDDWEDVVRTALYLESQKNSLGEFDEPLLSYKAYFKDNPIKIYVDLI